MKNIATEIKSTLEGINSRVIEAKKKETKQQQLPKEKKKQINNVEFRLVEISAAEQNKEKMNRKVKTV